MPETPETTEVTEATEAARTKSPVWGPWATAGFGVVVLAISFIVQAVASIVIITINLFSQLDVSSGMLHIGDFISAIEQAMLAYMGLITAVATIASAIICIFLVILLIRVRGGLEIDEYLGLHPVSGRVLWLSLGVVVAFMLLESGIGSAMDRPVPEFMMDIYGTSVWPPLLWVALVVFAPLFEEMLFRGFLFEGFRRSRLGPWGAVVLTALGWAILHVQYSAYEITSIFVLGLVLGAVRYKTGSVWSTVLMHTFNNLAAMFVLAMGLQ